jgi:hypothetical protein
MARAESPPASARARVVPTAPRDRAPHERARGEHSLNRHGHSRWWRETKLDLRRRVAMRLVADRDYVARLYHCKFGRYPDLATPAGFNEKILAKILGEASLRSSVFRSCTGGRIAPKRCPSIVCPTPLR